MKRLGIALTLALCTLTMGAQNYRYTSVKADSVHGLKHYGVGDNWFITVHGGANHSLSENARFGDFMDMTKYGFGLSVGKYFTPAIGVRTQFSLQNQASRANSEAIEAYPSVYGDGNYTFKNFAGYLDGLFNLNNIFGQYNENARFNVSGILGVGYNYTFGFDDKVEDWGSNSKVWDKPNGKYAPYDVHTDNTLSLAVRAGLLFSYRLSDLFDIELEATANGTDDAYNGTRYDRKYDTYVSAMLGLTYHFPDRYGDTRFRYNMLTDQGDIDAMNAKINEARAKKPVKPDPIVKVEEEVFRSELLNTTISFVIDKYNITDIQKKNVAEVAKYIEEHPDVNIVITGYADVQTAYPAYNLKLSERRAKAVFNCLVNEFGVDSARLRIDFKGDTVQPYKLKNEWNRVVIFTTEPRNIMDFQ